MNGAGGEAGVLGDYNAQRLGLALRRAREAAGYVSQADASRALGGIIDQGGLSRIESGGLEVPFWRVVALARLYRVSLDQLATEAGAPERI